MAHDDESLDDLHPAISQALVTGQWRGKVDKTLEVLTEEIKGTKQTVNELKDTAIVELRDRVTRLVVLMGVGGGIVTMICSVAVALIVKSMSR